NSVNFETGKKLHENRNNLDMKKKINDEICLEYGINNKQELKKEGEIITYDKNKYQIIKKGADITRLAESLLNVIQVATSKKDFSN
ncbi:relaxase/mobilization nuclease domain-containing protein, partial [Mammaliicoccus sciuri]